MSEITHDDLTSTDLVDPVEGGGDVDVVEVVGVPAPADPAVLVETVEAADPDPAGPEAFAADPVAHPVDDSEDEADSGGSVRGVRGRRTPTREQLEREGEIAADFLETLLDICDLDGDIDVDIDGDRAAVSIVDSDEGRVPRRLVGSDGVVLDALQELTRLAVYSNTGERSRLILDIAGHRSDRRSALVEVARVAIAAVKETGTKQALEPMTPFERKIVHDEVLAAGLRSESDGAEPRRYVVVHPV